MLEILAIIMLYNKNKVNALARGRKPEGFAGATFALWFGMELVGFLIGLAAKLETIAAYGLAFVFAIIGGLISYLIAKNCKPGHYVPPSVVMAENAARNARLLTLPARVDIIRESSMLGAVVSWSFTLNGKYIGSLSNGKAMAVVTDRTPSILQAKDAYGTEIAPFVFGVDSGGFAEVHFKANRFVPESSRGILPQGIPQPISNSSQPAPCVSQVLPSAISPTPPAFCHVCGSPMPADMMFCTKCGTQRAFTPQPGAMPASPPVSVPEPLVSNSMRAVWAAVITSGAWLITLLLHLVFPRIIYGSSFSGLLLCVVLGAGAYLLIQRGLKYRLSGAGILLLYVVIATVNQAGITASNQYGSLARLFKNLIIWPNLGYTLMGTAAIAGLSLLFSHIWRNAPEKKRVYGTGWIAAGGMLLFYAVLIIINYSPLLSSGKVLPVYMWLSIASDTLLAVATGLSVMLLSWVCRQKKGRIRLSAWAIVWCVLCIIGLAITFIASISTKYTVPWLAVLILAALAGYIILLCGCRAGFFIALTAICVFLLGMLESGLQNIVYGYSQNAGWIFSPLGVINPLITWFSVKSAWQGGDVTSYGSAAYAPSFQNSKTVRTFSKVATIIVLVVGAFLFLVPFPFMPKGFDESMLACILPGAAFVGFSIPAMVSLFGKNSRYHTWLDVLMQVLFWLICAAIVIGILAGVLSDI